tara:strand:- start:1007 stop:1120 length:114 start_codon:yes stop_codon:yes gene_type:complete
MKAILRFTWQMVLGAGIMFALAFASSEWFADLMLGRL